jgi:hypothetical protein
MDFERLTRLMKDAMVKVGLDPEVFTEKEIRELVEDWAKKHPSLAGKPN